MDQNRSAKSGKIWSSLGRKSSKSRSNAPSLHSIEKVRYNEQPWRMATDSLIFFFWMMMLLGLSASSLYKGSTGTLREGIGRPMPDYDPCRSSGPANVLGTSERRLYEDVICDPCRGYIWEALTCWPLPLLLSLSILYIITHCCCYFRYISPPSHHKHK